MRSPTYSLAALLAALHCAGAHAGPQACSEARLSEIRAPAGPGSGAVLIDCNLDLGPEELITKSLYFNHGELSNDVVVDCHGATLGSNDYSAGLPRLNVQSYFDGATGRWARPSNILVRNCRLLGNLNVNGIGGAATPEVRDSSHLDADHSTRMRDAAPTGITFDNLVVETQDRIAAYINVGATAVAIRNSEFRGRSPSTVIYLEAESGWHRIVDNRFYTSASREVIAVDGSTENVIQGNTFHDTHLGGIFLYRNCGEGATVRHATPQKNNIEANTFLDGSGPRNGYPHIVVASRNGNRKYCEDDAGYPYGSSVSNLDWARFTEIKGNHFAALAASAPAVVLQAGPSYVVDNTSDLLSALPTQDAWGGFFSHNAVGEAPDTTSSCFYRDGLPFLIRSGQMLDLDLADPRKATCATIETACVSGAIVTRSSACQAAQHQTVTVKCSGKWPSLACSRSIECPVGQQIQALKLACDLASGTITSGMLAGLEWNALKVFSTTSGNASCRAGGQAIQANSTQVLDFPKQRVSLGCVGDTAAGKNCSLRGQYVCRQAYSP
jgi:parallel beta-helix repeat protein